MPAVGPTGPFLRRIFMKSNISTSALLTEIFIYILAACLLVIDIGLWPLSGWYMKLRNITGDGFRITMVDNNAQEQMHYFIGRTKELFERCHYSFTNYSNPALNIVHTPKPDFHRPDFFGTFYL